MFINMISVNLSVLHVHANCDPILENQSYCHIEIHIITQFNMSLAKRFTELSKVFHIISGNSRCEVSIVITEKWFRYPHPSLWL